MSDELIRKSELIDTLNGWLSGRPAETMYGIGYDHAVRDIIKLIESEKPVKIVEMSNNQMLKDLIDRLTYYGTTYAIGDNLGREIDGTDELMLEAAECLGNCVELPYKTITEEESKRVVEEWINE